MAEKVIPCPYCSRKFIDADARWMHAKQKHKGLSLKAIRVERDREQRAKDLDGDESMADLMIRAQLQHAMGGPVEDEWLLDSLGA